MSTKKILDYSGPFGSKRPRSFFEKQRWLSRLRRKSQGCWARDAFTIYYEYEGVTVNAFCALCGRRVFRTQTLDNAIETLNLIDFKAVARHHPKEIYAAFLLFFGLHRRNSLSEQSIADLAAAGRAGQVVEEMLTDAQKALVREKSGAFITIWDGLDADEFNQFLSSPGDDSILRKHQMHYCNACTLAFCPTCVQRASEVAASKQHGICPECLKEQCLLL